MIRIIKKLVVAVRTLSKRIQNTAKWFRRLKSLQKNTLKLLNLAADGYGLYTMIEPQLKKQKK